MVVDGPITSTGRKKRAAMEAFEMLKRLAWGKKASSVSSTAKRSPMWLFSRRNNKDRRLIKRRRRPKRPAKILRASNSLIDETIYDPADYNPYPFTQQVDRQDVDRNNIDRQGFFGAGAGGGIGLGLAGALFGFAPFLLSVGGLLGAAVGLNLFANDNNNNVNNDNIINFNPNITYEGDNIVSNVTDDDTITNNNDQMQTNTATNDITNADTNNVNTAVNPINSNADGRIT